MRIAGKGKLMQMYKKLRRVLIDKKYVRYLKRK